MKILVVVPAYNEESTILPICKELNTSSVDCDILVVNDCSTDDTATVIAGYPGVFTAEHASNLGIGGAVQTGIKFADRNGYDVVVQFDADGQHLVSELPAILGPVMDGSADLVIGSRFAGGDNSFKSTLSRRFGIRILSAIIKLLTGICVLDVTSGFRAYGKKTLHYLRCYFPMDYPEPESIIMLSKIGMKIKEVPVVMRERQGGRSSIFGFMSVYYMLKVILALLIERIRSVKSICGGSGIS